MLRALLSRLPESQKKQLKALRARLRIVVRRIFPAQQNRVRSFCRQQKKRIINTYFSYRPEELLSRLRELGIDQGDTLLVHSSFNEFSGFSGSPGDAIDIFLKAVGASGNLLMVSLPYTSYTYEYLQTLKCFDVRKTPSRMGLISESFRRRPGVHRSLHPTHPVLAWGPKAEWIVAGHERALYPCGLATPFEKLALLEGKVLFFDASFFTFTFFHYLEELVKDKLSFPLYFKDPQKVSVIDSDGRTSIVTTFVYCPEANLYRRPEILKAQLEKRGLIKRAKIGNSRLLLVETGQVLSCVREMANQGIYFYTHS